MLAMYIYICISIINSISFEIVPYILYYRYEIVSDHEELLDRFDISKERLSGRNSSLH